MSKKIIIWIIIGVIVVVAVIAVVIFFPGKEGKPEEKEGTQPSAEEGAEEEGTVEESGLTEEQIETIIGQPASEKIQPIIEGGAVVGVVTGSVPFEEPSGESSTGEVIGGAGSDLQEEINRIKQQK